MKSLPSAEPLSADATSVWLQQACELLQQSAWGEHLRYDGVDLLDVLRSPLYLALRATTRREVNVDDGMWRRGLAAARMAGYRFQVARRTRKLSVQTAAVEPAEVLFWPREPTHLKSHLPILRQVRNQGTPAVLLACHPAAVEGVLAAGETPVFAPAAWPKELQAAGLAATEAVRQMRHLDPPPVEQFADASERRLLVAQLRSTLFRHLPLAYEAVTNARLALDRFGARALVVGNDMTVEGRAACLVAAGRQISSFCPMHGTLVGNPLYRFHVADRLLLYGENARRQLLSLQVDEARMRVCGAPYLDNCPRQSGELEPRIVEQLGLDPARPYVLVATSGPGNMISHRHHVAMIQAVMQASVELPDVQFVAKLHRKDQLEFYEQPAAAVPGHRLSIVRNATEGLPGDIFSWLQGARAMITGASAVATEAMLLGVPVITMDLAGELAGIDFIDRGATQHVTDPASLAEAVRHALSGGAVAEQARRGAEAYARDLFFALDGHSAERAATIIRTESLTHTTQIPG